MDRRISRGNTRLTCHSRSSPHLKQGPHRRSEATFETRQVWAIRVRLERTESHRDLALFDIAIDSTLRGCDLMRMKAVDVVASGQIKERASVL